MTPTDDACTLMALLREGKPMPVDRVLPGWDMLQADLPSRERLEGAASVLVGSGLAQVDERWDLWLTAEGGRIRRSVGRGRGMRRLPGDLRDSLADRELASTPLTLPVAVYDPALEGYLARARRRAERARRRTWWWPWR